MANRIKDFNMISEPSNRFQLFSAKDTFTLMIYGYIGKDFWEEESNDAKTIVNKLEEARGMDLNVRINSSGGSVFDAIAIVNGMNRFEGNVITDIDGMAFSAGSLIAAAGNPARIAENASAMIHAPKSIISGPLSSSNHREIADALDKLAVSIVPTYARGGKVSAEKVSEMLLGKEDNLFTAKEALDFGLVDEITSAFEVAAHFSDEAFLTMSAAADEQIGRVMTDNVINEGGNGEVQAGAENYVANHKAIAAKSVDRGAQMENSRIRAIQKEFDGFIDDPTSTMATLMDACIDDRNCTVDMSIKRIVDALKQESGFPIDMGQAQPQRTITPRRESRITHGPDQSDKFVEGATKALMIKNNMDKDGKISKGEYGSEYLSMSLVELCKESLRISGGKTGGSTEDVVRRVIMAGPGQGTDHFPAITENIANKSVMDGYLEAEETWSQYTQTGTLNDYRQASRVNKSLFDKLDKMEEYEKFQAGRFSDVKQNIQGYLHGKTFSLTLQAIVNDELGLLSEDARAWGEAAAVTIGDSVFLTMFTAGTGGFGQTMDEDSQIIFHADHSNYLASGAGAVPSTATISAGRTAMMTQLDPNGRTVASRPRYLLHGTTLTMGVFTILNSQEYITGADVTQGSRNPVASLGIQGVEEYRFDDTTVTPAATAWALLARRRTVEVSFVGGQSTPRVDRMATGEIPGISWQISIPFGVAALDFRTLYLNFGA